MNRFDWPSMDDANGLSFPHAMFTLLSIGILSSVVILVVARAVAMAPIGYEDHGGFHEGVAAETESGSKVRTVSRSSPGKRKTPSFVAIR